MTLLTRLLEVTVAALVAGVVVIVSAQVWVRYFLNASLDWSEELARILLVWLTCLGAGLAMQRGAHVRVDLVGPLLPPRARAWLDVSLDLLMLAFLAVLLVKGPSLVRVSYTVETPALSIPTSFIFAAPWVGALTILPYVIRDTVGHLTAARRAGTPARAGAARET